ncbi:MAG: MBOAT family protein [Dysgonamonadaceae bacterium]|jgi:D-alanyl-lipoteichoic acid acyltransferase DltB (MBOAT superfamily)|nr:MBOAT family protein [Dysgonamonadaceae bacterium]
MLFGSLSFLLFFSIFFVLYWLAFQRNLKLRNGLILLASFVFYACWDWRFLLLLIANTSLAYLVGLRLAAHDEKKRKYWLTFGVIVEVALLFYFKYTNFFITSLIDCFHSFGLHTGLHTLKIILPLGISFYVFRTLSYLIDVYYERIEPETDGLIFFAYITFFPSMVCGPIDRAKLLIPQLQTIRKFDYCQVADGLKQVLWGLFKKVVVADNAALFVNRIFEDYHQMPSSVLLLGAFLFTIQMYADFSGYSDMAIGLANMMGIRITRNFRFPFFAQNIADFWKRWHISLTNWLTDFIFTPLSIRFRDWGKTGLILSILITFLVSGLWHGANWTFVLWGLLHGCCYIPLIIKGSMNKNKKLSAGLIPTFKEFRLMTGMFILIMFSLVLFRSDSIADAYHYFCSIFTFSGSEIPYFLLEKRNDLCAVLTFTLFFVVMEWIHREKEHALQLAFKVPFWVRWIFYYFLILMVYVYQVGQQAFIYLQF